MIRTRFPYVVIYGRLTMEKPLHEKICLSWFEADWLFYSQKQGWMHMLIFALLFEHHAIPCTACADPEGGGGRGSRPPPWKIKNIGFSSNTGGDHLPSQRSMLDHHRHASERPFNGVSLVGRWWPAYSCTWILLPAPPPPPPPPKNKKTNPRQSWTPWLTDETLVFR